ncbi:Callose synthase 7 [Morella rubra]|uniref:1,3-beta-glucan synthase n=1 Tax=Morella rubra TaxID=262757 RepID=A0A6A1UI70_9ROSI|nr:Callose synthase 7 [Morella rubra]
MASTSGTKPPGAVDGVPVPSSLASIAPILRVADEIQKENHPRVAFLCRYYAFERANELDPTSTGRGVREFKTKMSRRLGKGIDSVQQLMDEIFKNYTSWCNYLRCELNLKFPDPQRCDRQQLKLIYIGLYLLIWGEASNVRFMPECLCYIFHNTERYAADVEKKKELYEPYNILPLYAAGFKQKIMDLPEIEAAFHSLQKNVDKLPIPSYSSATATERVKSIRDILDWLSAIFGFQGIDSVQQLMDEIFKNYTSWCNYLRCELNLKFPDPQRCDRQQLKLIYIGLYLLIWGEASNVRFMPECLCYIFHNMADEVHKIVNGDPYQPKACGEESFLQDVITPIYQVLLKEVGRDKEAKKSLSVWRNYDDLNEYFWLDKCIKPRWSTLSIADLFGHSDEIQPANERAHQAAAGKREPKANFVEVRTFWHLYRSFARMWILFILAFQLMVIVAWSQPSGSLAVLFDADVFRSVLSIFITWAFLNLLQATMEIILTWNAWKNLKFSQIIRYLLKFAVAAMWAVVLPIGYASFAPNPTGLVKFFSGWGGDWRNQSFYTYAVAIFLVPNILAAVLFLAPPLKRRMERSNRRIFNLLRWWAQASKTPVGKLHGVFDEGTNNIGAVIAIWGPIVLVYIMDTQIWYAIFSALFGAIHGAFSHLGEIRTLGMLRTKFHTVPNAFHKYLVPSANKDTKSEDQDESQAVNLANFSRVWNEFINSMRMEDLLSNRDREMLLVPYPSNDVSVVQWPLFLLASKIPIALDLARGKDDDELLERIKSDYYMDSAVTECYKTLRHIISCLLLDENDKKILERICKKIDQSIVQRTIFKQFKMSELPQLSEQLEKFLKLSLAVLDEDSKLEITNNLQCIFYIITKDIMVGGSEILENANLGQGSRQMHPFVYLDFEAMQNKSWKEEVVRLHLLLTVKESAISVPQNLEARRRITFFVNSLFMKMPRAPRVQDMLSFSVLTPYYKEDVLYSEDELNMPNEDGISTLFYLQKIYPGTSSRTSMCSWNLWEIELLVPTLFKTWFHFAPYGKLNEGDTKALADHAQALVDLKLPTLSLVSSMGIREILMILEKSNNIRNLMSASSKNVDGIFLTSSNDWYPSLRVAYIDEREELVNRQSQKFYFSVLVKGGDNLDHEEIYRIKLPGNPIDIGEGKPENQNHAIIFTRGEALQTIDMNQDNYFEEAFKMRNVLNEFLQDRHGKHKPSILGLREYVFTGSVSSLAWFMSNQETSFVTIGQRILANPLRNREATYKFE